MGWMLLALVCAIPVSRAQENQANPEEEWNKLTKEQREILRERYQAFRNLTPEQQQEIRDRLEQLRKKRKDTQETTASM